MKTVDLTKSAPHLKALIYGDSGAGKTFLLGTAQQCKETFPLLVLNARGQPITLRHFDPPPCILGIENMSDFNFVYGWLDRGQPRGTAFEGKEEIAYCIEYLDSIGEEKFKTVGVDSITHVQRISLEGIVGSPDKIGDVPPQAQIQHWGQTLRQLVNLADHFYNLPMHVILNALTRNDKIESLGITMYAPFLWGQSSAEIPSHAELVARLIPIDSIETRKIAQLEKAYEEVFKREEPFNVLLTKGGRNFLAKWQGPLNPPSVVVAPTIEKIMKVIEEV